MTKRNRIFFTFLLVLLLTVSFSAIAFADDGDYDLGEAEWDWAKEDKAMGMWDKPEDATTYYVRLYKGSSLIFDWKKASTSKYDFTQYVIKKGTGNYTFEVYPAKGGEGMAVTSDVLEVDSTYLKNMKNAQKAATQAAQTADGWHSNPNGTWTYGKGNNTLAKNEWLTIDGVTYHFDNNGYMATGWVLISGIYYYFDKTSGALYRNCTTPDGYQVNADGAWIDGSGTVVQQASKKNVTNNVAKSVSITISETGADGKVRNAAVTGCSHGTVLSYTFSKPYEQWSPGSTVKLTVVIEPRNGYVFLQNKTKFTCSNGTVTGFSGADPTTVTINYTPRMRLESPKNVYIGSDGIVRWVKVPNAKAYRVTLSYDGSSSKKSYVVEKTEFDVMEYGDLEYDAANVKVSALYSATKSSSTHLESEAVTVGSVSYYENESSINGEFGGTSQNMYYTDDTGEKVTGWQEIGGKWYYFKKDKMAAGPGWFQDTDGNWYWFDANHVMQVGKINDGTADYFMNDGTSPNYPYGAWVQ